MLELNKVYNEDCIGEKGMCLIKDKSVDMIFCDLPYGTTARNRWDTIIPFKQLWEQYERVIKDNGVIALFAKSPFDKSLAMSNINLYKYEWIWYKNKVTGHLNSKKMPMQAHENILIFYKKLPIYNPQMSEGHKPMNYAVNHHDNISTYGDGKETKNQAGTTKRYPKTILEFNVVNQDSSERIHPSQKPVDLCEYFINTYTNEGETVLDNCMGSFTTAIACINTNRNYIGFENDDKYFALGQERLENLKYIN